MGKALHRMHNEDMLKISLGDCFQATVIKIPCSDRSFFFEGVSALGGL